ncbi:hypothetical protein DL96DRAFT_1552447 [Flagelloscypha sp. PMI_526]|nr:hypothetical protein DL96DRAFT_1552447 [Flagelloscypha sp. PMI_526]
MNMSRGKPRRLQNSDRTQTSDFGYDGDDEHDGTTLLPYTLLRDAEYHNEETVSEPGTSEGEHEPGDAGESSFSTPTLPSFTETAEEVMASLDDILDQLLYGVSLAHRRPPPSPPRYSNNPQMMILEYEPISSLDSDVSDSLFELSGVKNSGSLFGSSGVGKSGGKGEVSPNQPVAPSSETGSTTRISRGHFWVERGRPWPGFKESCS